jgi:pyruvate carboxylase
LFSDRFTQHRYKCDQAFELDTSKGPVAQYLDIANIVKICQTNNVQAVHPGYGLLSENENFAAALEKAGIVFVGPTVQNLNAFGNKATARNIAIECGVPVVPGSEQAFATVHDARAWINDPANNCDYPVIVKALMVRLSAPLLASNIFRCPYLIISYLPNTNRVAVAVESVLSRTPSCSNLCSHKLPTRR